MRRTVTLLTVLVLGIGASACLQHTYAVGTGAPDGEVVYSHWHHHWLFALIRPELQEQLDIAELCPTGNATIHQEVTFANGLVDVLTWFIYTPTTVTVQCESGESRDVELSEEAVARITSDPRFLEFIAEVAPERLEEARLRLAQTIVPGDSSEPTPAAR
jgi:hypothetical protein